MTKNNKSCMSGLAQGLTAPPNIPAKGPAAYIGGILGGMPMSSAGPGTAIAGLSSGQFPLQPAQNTGPVNAFGARNRFGPTKSELLEHFVYNLGVRVKNYISFMDTFYEEICPVAETNGQYRSIIWSTVKFDNSPAHMMPEKSNGRVLTYSISQNSATMERGGRSVDINIESLDTPMGQQLLFESMRQMIFAAISTKRLAILRAILLNDSTSFTVLNLNNKYANPSSMAGTIVGASIEEICNPSMDSWMSMLKPYQVPLLVAALGEEARRREGNAPTRMIVNPKTSAYLRVIEPTQNSFLGAGVTVGERTTNPLEKTTFHGLRMDIANPPRHMIKEGVVAPDPFVREAMIGEAFMAGSGRPNSFGNPNALNDPYSIQILDENNRGPTVLTGDALLENAINFANNAGTKAWRQPNATVFNALKGNNKFGKIPPSEWANMAFYDNTGANRTTLADIPASHVSPADWDEIAISVISRFGQAGVVAAITGGVLGSASYNPLDNSVVEVTKAIKTLPNEYNTYKKFVQNRVMGPFRFLVFRCFMSYNTNTVVFMAENCLQGFQDKSTFLPYYKGHDTLNIQSAFSFGVAVTEPADIHVVHNCTPSSRIAGCGSGFIPLDKFEPAKGKYGDPKDTNSSLLCWMVGPNQFNDIKYPLSIEGVLDPYDNRYNVQSIIGNEKFHFDGAPVFNALLRLSEQLDIRFKQRVPTRGYGAEQNTPPNLVCYRGDHSVLNPKTGEWTTIRGNGHWAGTSVPGHEQVRDGKLNSLGTPVIQAIMRH